jgi:hypothetical protein
MSKSDGFFVRPKFPVAEPDSSVQPQPQQAPQQEPMNQEQVNAMIVKDLTEMGFQVPEKCHACPDLAPCAMMQILNVMAGGGSK